MPVVWLCPFALLRENMTSSTKQELHTVSKKAEPQSQVEQTKNGAKYGCFVTDICKRTGRQTNRKTEKRPTYRYGNHNTADPYQWRSNNELNSSWNSTRKSTHSITPWVLYSISSQYPLHNTVWMTLRKNEETRLDAFEMKGLRKILQVSWTAKKTNEWVLNKARVKRLSVKHCQSKETSILWSHHEETRELPGARDNARNDARCTQARKTMHGLDGQYQYMDRTPCGRVNQNDKGQR